MATATKTRRQSGRAAAPEARRAASDERAPREAPVGNVDGLGRSGDGPILSRSGKEVRLRVHGTVDQFAFDPAIVPPGWTYEWKRHSTFGQVDQQHLVNLELNGWEAVPAERHAGMFMDKEHKGAIIRDGMILMERDDRLTAEVHRQEKIAAQDQLRSSRQIAGLMPASRITDMEHPSARAKTGVGVERMPTLTDRSKYTYEVDEE